MHIEATGWHRLHSSLSNLVFETDAQLKGPIGCTSGRPALTVHMFPLFLPPCTRWGYRRWPLFPDFYVGVGGLNSSPQALWQTLYWPLDFPVLAVDRKFPGHLEAGVLSERSWARFPADGWIPSLSLVSGAQVAAISVGDHSNAADPLLCCDLMEPRASPH